MAAEPEGGDFLWGGLEAAGIVAAVEIAGSFESGSGFGGAAVVENLLVGIE